MTKLKKRRRGARAPKDEWEEEEQGKHFTHPNSRSHAPAENTGNHYKLIMVMTIMMTMIMITAVMIFHTLQML